MGPLVSIVIPTLNRRDLLLETLASVQSQSYSNWEAIVVDDASRDGTCGAVAQLAEEDARIRLVKREGNAGGAHVCRNQGLAAARGKYVIFMDSDDLLAPNCLEHRVATIEGEPSLDYVVSGTERFHWRPGDLGLLLNGETGEDDLERFLRYDGPWQTMSPMWASESLRRVGLQWDQRLVVGQDIDFHCRALVLGLKHRHTGSVDCFYRTWDDGRETISGQRRTEAWYRSHADRIMSAHDLMQKYGILTEIRRLLVLGNYLQWATEAAAEGRVRVALAIWSRSASCGLNWSLRMWGVAFLLSCRTWLSPLLFRGLMSSWPDDAFIFTRRTLGCWPRNGVPDRRPAAVTDSCHPLQRFAGPLREGTVLYVLRRLHPVRFARAAGRDLGWRPRSGRMAPAEIQQLATAERPDPAPLAG